MSQNRFICLTVEDDDTPQKISIVAEIDKHLQELFNCICYVEQQCDYQLVLKYHSILYKMLDKFKYMIKSVLEHNRSKYFNMIPFIRKRIRYVLSYEAHTC